ncbi:UNVERIFIED_CONTAM: hypothetical protein ABIC26_002738 [Paenibacillus sp. PvR008]
MKTLMYITMEQVEEKQLDDTDTYTQFIKHPRVSVDEDQEIIVYYKEDEHSFELVKDGFDMIEDLESAGYYLTIGNNPKGSYGNITIDYVSIVKDMLEEEYHTNSKPPVSIKEWIELRVDVIAIKHLEKIIQGIKEATIKVSL